MLKKVSIDMENNILSKYNRVDNYYRNRNNMPNIRWNNIVTHKNFIKEFLKLGEKQSLIENNEKLGSLFDNLDNMRIVHTNSVYHLGIYLMNKLNISTHTKIINLNYNDNININEFKFVWFLASLFHDFGYYIEQDNANADRFPTISDFYNFYEIENKLLNQEICFNDDELISLKNCICEYYTKAVRGEASSSNRKKIDHGISAGLLLWDRLEKLRQSKNENSNSSALNWGENVKKLHIYVSYIIAVHNIRGDKCSNIDDTHKISFDESPLLFIFLLVDAIEFTKLYKECEPKYVLENIGIEVNHRNSIVFSFESCMSASDFYNKIKNITTYLNIEIPNITSQVEIKIL